MRIDLYFVNPPNPALLPTGRWLPVYLIPSFDDDDEAESILKKIYDEIFERALDGWHTDESAWPAILAPRQPVTI